MGTVKQDGKFANVYKNIIFFTVYKGGEAIQLYLDYVLKQMICYLTKINLNISFDLIQIV